jgi:hypothetical protein
MPVAGVVVVLVATVVGLLLGSDVVSDEVARAMVPTVVPTVGVVLRDPLAGLWRGMGAPGVGAGVVLVALVVGSDAIELASGESAGGVPRRGFVMIASYWFDKYVTITRERLVWWLRTRAGTETSGVVVGYPSRRRGRKILLITCQSFVPIVDEERKER